MAGDNGCHKDIDAMQRCKAQPRSAWSTHTLERSGRLVLAVAWTGAGRSELEGSGMVVSAPVPVPVVEAPQRNDVVRLARCRSQTNCVVEYRDGTGGEEDGEIIERRRLTCQLMNFSPCLSHGRRVVKSRRRGKQWKLVNCAARRADKKHLKS